MDIASTVSLAGSGRARDDSRRHRLSESSVSFTNRLARALWNAIWALLFRPSPIVAHGWRRMLLRLFGAKIGHGSKVYPSARIWAPWHLEMGEFACLGPYVICYSVDRISLGRNSVVSQYSYLCSASHDIDSADFTLMVGPISIDAFAWVAADAFVGPKVIIGEGAVVGARACVFKDVEPWTVVGGNPACTIGTRSRAIAARSGAR